MLDYNINKKLFQDTIFYHGTNSRFKTFEYRNNDIGFHFGTIEQAIQRLDDCNVPDENRILIKAKLNVKNPIRIRDIGHFTLETILHELSNDISFKHDKKLFAIKNIEHLRSYLIQLGHNGLVYLNEKEVSEADFYIKKAEHHVKLFEEHTNEKFLRCSTNAKRHENYLLAQLYYQKSDDMIKKHAKDSIIVFRNNQIIRQL